MTKVTDYKDAKAILSEICMHHSHTLGYTETKEALEELEDITVDYRFELDGNEYRIIAEYSIWDIYVEEIKAICEDCYELNIPQFMQGCIDWDAVATNCIADGYAHTFSSYDGSELEAAGYYIYRTD